MTALDRDGLSCFWGVWRNTEPHRERETMVVVVDETTPPGRACDSNLATSEVLNNQEVRR